MCNKIQMLSVSSAGTLDSTYSDALAPQLNTIPHFLLFFLFWITTYSHLLTKSSLVIDLLLMIEEMIQYSWQVVNWASHSLHWCFTIISSHYPSLCHSIASSIIPFGLTYLTSTTSDVLSIWHLMSRQIYVWPNYWFTCHPCSVVKIWRNVLWLNHRTILENF